MALTATSAELQQQIDWVLTLANTDPKLMEAYTAYQNGDEAGFKAAVLASDFYKNNNATARQRKQAQAQQPGVSTQDLNNYILGTKKRLIQSGISWTPDVEKIVTDGYWMGMTDNQLDASIASSGKLKVSGGGTPGDYVNQAKQLANSYGVADLLGNEYWSSKEQLLFSGNTTSADIENEIKGLAASTFPAYADLINKGVPLASAASNVIQTVAKYLELDPNSLTFGDSRVRKIMQFTDASGKPAIMPQWMVEKTVKSDPSWAYTNNARDTFDSLTLKVAKDWGLA
jgi:hypothetical protein